MHEDRGFAHRLEDFRKRKPSAQPQAIGDAQLSGERLQRVTFVTVADDLEAEVVAALREEGGGANQIIKAFMLAQPPDGENAIAVAVLGAIGEPAQIEAVMADMDLASRARTRESPSDITLIEFATGDNVVGVLDLLPEKHRRGVQIDAGMEPDRKRNLPIGACLGDAMERIGARAGIIAPVGQDVVVAIAKFIRPRPRFGKDVSRLRKDDTTLPRGTRQYSEQIAQRDERVAHERRERAADRRGERQMVYAFPRQMLGAQQIERVLPHGRIERCNGEYVDLDPRIDEGPHVPLEEGR